MLEKSEGKRRRGLIGRTDAGAEASILHSCPGWEWDKMHTEIMAASWLNLPFIILLSM